MISRSEAVPDHIFGFGLAQFGLPTSGCGCSGSVQFCFSGILTSGFEAAGLVLAHFGPPKSGCGCSGNILTSGFETVLDHMFGLGLTHFGGQSQETPGSIPEHPSKSF